MEFSVAAIKAMELAQGQAEINTALDGSLPKELPNVSQKLDGSLPLESEGAQHENHELQGDLPGETGEGAPEELVDVEIDTELSGVEQGLSSWDKLATTNAAGEKEAFTWLVFAVAIVVLFLPILGSCRSRLNILSFMPLMPAMYIPPDSKARL